jgi:hypothetical protein
VYGWAFDDYRHSGRAVLPGRNGPVTLEPAAIDSFETVVHRLQKEHPIRQRWDDAELWGVVAAAIVELSELQQPERAATELLRRLREADASLVVLVVANVTWQSAPVEIAGGVLGEHSQEFVDVVRTGSAGRESLDSEGGRDWLASRLAADEESAPPVLAAYWTDGQRQLAIDNTERWLQAVVDLALLFEGDISGKDLWSLRGGHNRPGVRGTTMHRPAIEKLLAAHPDGHLDIASEPYLATPTSGQVRSARWHSADPVPLDAVLRDEAVFAIVHEAATGEQALYRRLRVAARSAAEAHWAIDSSDASLALGVALDSLVGSRSGLPSRFMAQRFALLEDEPSKRRERVKRYNEVFAVRSAVAHGGESSKATGAFVRGVAEDVRWAARRLVSLHRTFNTPTETDVDATFEALALGEPTWSLPSTEPAEVAPPVVGVPLSVRVR